MIDVLQWIAIGLLCVSTLLLLSLLEYGFSGFRYVDEDIEHFWPAQGLDNWVERLEKLQDEEVCEYHRRDCEGDPQ